MFVRRARLPVRLRGETMYWQDLPNANTPLSVTPLVSVPIVSPGKSYERGQTFINEIHGNLVLQASRF